MVEEAIEVCLAFFPHDALTFLYLLIFLFVVFAFLESELVHILRRSDLVIVLNLLIIHFLVHGLKSSHNMAAMCMEM